jgi:hypothetical protein
MLVRSTRILLEASMRPSRRLAIVALCAFAVALPGCGGGGVKKQINPPRASIQQLTVLPNGQWKLVLRMQNFSNVPTQFSTLSGKLSFGDHPAGDLSASPNMNIGPASADTVETTMTPSLEAKMAVASALSASQSVRYSFEGKIGTSQRSTPYDFKFESSLNPAPGLPGVLR